MSNVSKKLFNFIILLPLAIVLIILCVANRQSITLALNPFQPSDSVLAFTAPFFVFLFAALIIGVVLGSFVTWVSQSSYRTLAKRKVKEDEALRRSASVREEELQRELDVYRRQAGANTPLLRG
jgi:uncharacterized integral membrane protein